MFTIDGFRWPFACDIERTAEIRSSEVSGEMLDGGYYNDVLGTYMTYSVRVVVPLNQRNLYVSLNNLLTDPKGGHQFNLPDQGGTLNVNGRVTNVSDVYVRMPGGEQYWKGIRFDIIANHATRSYTMDQMSAQGRIGMPEAADHHEGDTWVWHAGRWELSYPYIDADTKRY